MTISYPLSPPASPKQSAVKWRRIHQQGFNSSPFALADQVHDYKAERWGIDVSIDPLDRTEAAAWLAFLTALRGRKGTFLFGDAIMTLMGAGGGTPLVDGANQNAETLVTDGWPNGTLVLKAGDFFSVSNRLHMVLTDTTSNGSGQATIDIWPRARIPLDDAPLTLTNPVSLFRLVSTADDFDVGRSQFINISFRAEEAF